MDNTITTTVCAGCGQLWLGMIWGIDLCNDCRAEQLMDEQMKHREAPDDAELEAMYLNG